MNDFEQEIYFPRESRSNLSLWGRAKINSPIYLKPQILFSIHSLTSPSHTSSLAFPSPFQTKILKLSLFPKSPPLPRNFLISLQNAISPLLSALSELLTAASYAPCVRLHANYTDVAAASQQRERSGSEGCALQTRGHKFFGFSFFCVRAPCPTPQQCSPSLRAASRSTSTRSPWLPALASMTTS